MGNIKRKSKVQIDHYKLSFSSCEAVNLDVMDVAESFSSSIFVTFTNLYQSTSLKELIHKLFKQDKQEQYSLDFAEGYPCPFILFGNLLSKEMDFYDKNDNNKDCDEYIHYTIIESIDLVCNRNQLFLKHMTLFQYQKLVNRILFNRIINKGRILCLWYFTTLLQKTIQNDRAS